MTHPPPYPRRMILTNHPAFRAETAAPIRAQAPVPALRDSVAFVVKGSYFAVFIPHPGLLLLAHLFDMGQHYRGGVGNAEKNSRRRRVHTLLRFSTLFHAICERGGGGPSFPPVQVPVFPLRAETFVLRACNLEPSII